MFYLFQTIAVLTLQNMNKYVTHEKGDLGSTHLLQFLVYTFPMLKLNTMQLVTPGVNHCCLMAIVYDM